MSERDRQHEADLLPCPFCDSAAKIRTTQQSGMGDTNRKVSIYCPECGIPETMSFQYTRIIYLKNMWNTRGGDNSVNL